LVGGDPEPDLSAAEALLPTMKGDPQYASYIRWGRAWQAFAAGRLSEARRMAESATEMTSYFLPVSMPLAARAALWDRDPDAARQAIDRLDASVVRGQAFGLDRVTLRAGLAALEGRRAEAVAGYRDALRGWRQLSCAFDEALAIVDLAGLLAPTDPEMAEATAAIETAHETLSRLGALPLLARLEGARTDPVPARPGPRVDVATASSSEVRA
jgi:hypothetical protein